MMFPRRAGPSRLTLRTRPPPPASAILSGTLGLALIGLAALMRDDPRQLLPALSGVALVLYLLWTARPCPTVVIDLKAGHLSGRSALGRLERQYRFSRVDEVTTDRVSLPSPRPGTPGRMIFRTVMHTDGGTIPVQGFGAPAPARALARQIDDWLARATGPARAL